MYVCNADYCGVYECTIISFLQIVFISATFDDAYLSKNMSVYSICFITTFTEHMQAERTGICKEFARSLVTIWFLGRAHYGRAPQPGGARRWDSWNL